MMMKHIKNFNESKDDRFKNNIKDILIDFKDRGFSISVVNGPNILIVIIEVVYGSRDGVMKQLSEPIKIIDEESEFKMLFDYIENKYQLYEIRWSEHSNHHDEYTLNSNDQENEYDTFYEVLKNRNLLKIVLHFEPTLLKRLEQ